MMTREEAAQLRVGDKVVALVEGWSEVEEGDVRREDFHPGDKLTVADIEHYESQGLTITVCADNGAVNVFDEADYDGKYPFAKPDDGESMASYSDVLKARKRGKKWPRALTMWGYIDSDAQWRETVNDARRFVDAGWPHQAAALGWTEENAVGLIWSLRGRRVIAMTARRAAMMSESGKVTFYRRMEAK